MFSVIIAEPERFEAKKIAAFFRNEGFCVTVASNGREALSLLDRMYVDIIIAEHSMPILGGVELIRERRGADNGIPVIVLGAKMTFRLSEWNFRRVRMTSW